ncbi:MAG TPA: transposase, partial [Chloroflexota bacterium]|nr:transposase [Chloroflexota bacterium]
IPTRDNEHDHDNDRNAYRERPMIERTINRLKRFRRIATRDEKRTSSSLAMVTLACILEWL